MELASWSSNNTKILRNPKLTLNQIKESTFPLTSPRNISWDTAGTHILKKIRYTFFNILFLLILKYYQILN